MRGYLSRFALILALVRVAESEGNILEEALPEDVYRAWQLTKYFVGHGNRVYDELRGERDEGRETRLICLTQALGNLLKERSSLYEDQ